MCTVEMSPEIWHRDDFPLLCSWRKLWRAVEIGVDRAEFSNMFLSKWSPDGHEYFGVDPYVSTGGFKCDRRADMSMAAIRYERHARRARLLISTSEEVANGLADFQDRHTPDTDFVYIDADHSYEAAARDIALWWPKVSDIGILAGHDFDDTHPGVQQAVQEFSARERVTIYLTNESRCASWYCYKRGIPGPDWQRNDVAGQYAWLRH